MKLISHSSCGVKFTARVEKLLSVFLDFLDEGRLGVMRPDGQLGISEKILPVPLITLEAFLVPTLGLLPLVSTERRGLRKERYRESGQWTKVSHSRSVLESSSIQHCNSNFAL